MKKVKITFNTDVSDTFKPGNCLECPFRTIINSYLNPTEQLDTVYGTFIFDHGKYLYRVKCNIGFHKDCCPIKITKVR